MLGEALGWLSEGDYVGAIECLPQGSVGASREVLEEIEGEVEGLVQRLERLAARLLESDASTDAREVLTALDLVGDLRAAYFTRK